MKYLVVQKFFNVHLFKIGEDSHFDDFSKGLNLNHQAERHHLSPTVIHQTSPNFRFRGFAFVTLGSVAEAQARILGDKGWEGCDLCAEKRSDLAVSFLRWFEAIFSNYDNNMFNGRWAADSVATGPHDQRWSLKRPMLRTRCFSDLCMNS